MRAAASRSNSPQTEHASVAGGLGFYHLAVRNTFTGRRRNAKPPNDMAALHGITRVLCVINGSCFWRIFEGLLWGVGAYSCAICKYGGVVSFQITA